jgi:hypothetical protein
MQPHLLNCFVEGQGPYYDPDAASSYVLLVMLTPGWFSSHSPALNENFQLMDKILSWEYVFFQIYIHQENWVLSFQWTIALLKLSDPRQGTTELIGENIEKKSPRMDSSHFLLTITYYTFIIWQERKYE